LFSDCNVWNWASPHLKKGQPTYVAVWEVVDNKIKIVDVEVVYVGTHEKAEQRDRRIMICVCDLTTHTDHFRLKFLARKILQHLLKSLDFCNPNGYISK